jgi:predicted component of type VI protein secretion system
MRYSCGADERERMIIYWLKHKGTFFPVHQGDSLLGRSPECLIVLPSERVSREHAVVRRIHCGLEIEDLGSRNGTWVNGSRIRRATVLQQGDEVQLGDDVLEVVLKPNAQIPVTVAGVTSSLSEESSRQRQVLEQVEFDMAQLGPADDYAAAAGRMRASIDELMSSLGDWGVVLSAEEVRRLTNVAHALAGWARSYQFERWSLSLEARLLRGSTPEI